jgi:uncharacterized membrane protein YhaH (DUF805 family)
MSAPVTSKFRANRGLFGWWVPTGRIRRSDWWLRYFLVFVLLGIVATVLDGYFFPDNPMFEPDPDPGFDLLVPLPDAVGPVTAVTGLVLFVPNVTALVARLHDRDHSPWWLLWAFVPGIGTVVLFVTIALLGTDPRPNRYGLPPAP